MQAGYEKALKPATVCGANPDIVTGWGLIDSHNTMYLPQSVVDNEMAAMAAAAPRRRSRSRTRRSPTESIAKVGPGGGFLAERETARRIRAGEHYLPTVSNRLSYEKWVEEGVTENDVADGEVEAPAREARRRGPCLEADQIDELAAICGVDEDLRAPRPA